jgi:hypothetical protein
MDLSNLRKLQKALYWSITHAGHLEANRSGLSREVTNGDIENLKNTVDCSYLRDYIYDRELIEFLDFEPTLWDAKLESFIFLSEPIESKKRAGEIISDDYYMYEFDPIHSLLKSYGKLS